MSSPTVSNVRIQSIDVVRALTMLLMIWVNDFWSLSGIPNWLQHMPAEADALGFSDVIFPAFLVIVGLSIPFALSSRAAKGQSTAGILRHIAERSVALLVMGFFMVNLEYADGVNMRMPKPLWQALMIVAFFLIWNVYPVSSDRLRTLFKTLRLAGWGLLAVLAATYQAGTIDNPIWMRPHWWGILGLIGWSYLICASVYLFIGNRVTAIGAAWAGFALLNIGEFAGWFDAIEPIKRHVWVVGGGSMPALTMSGALVSTIYLNLSESARRSRFFWIALGIGLAQIGIGLALRPEWGISKIRATPAWTELCAGITLVAYAAIYWIVDLRGKRRWPTIFGAAGTATLTCYLLPYLAYLIVGLLWIHLPDTLSTGVVGLLRSLAFAFAIVWLTKLIVMRGVALRI